MGMTKEERLEKMKIGSYIPRHGRIAAEVFEGIKKEASKKSIVIADDEYWPWHVIAAGPNVGQLISLFCKGFRRDIDVQVLTKEGLEDRRYAEESFATVRGALNYVLRLQKKWRNPE